MITLRPQVLTRENFAPFGEVVDHIGMSHITINQGYARKFVDAAKADIAAEDGTVSVSLFVAEPRPKGIAIMERHPLGSQMFYPLQDVPWLVVVCRDPRDVTSFICFEASGKQGVNYARGTWHHPLIGPVPGSRFMVVDRKGPGNNLEEVSVQGVQLA